MGRTLERGLEVLDWIAAALLLGAGAVAFLVGIVFGLLSFGDRGTLGGHEGTLAMAAALGTTGILCVIAARGMRARARWRWWAQAAPLPVFVLLWTAALCVFPDVTVRAGSLVLCGRP